MPPPRRTRYIVFACLAVILLFTLFKHSPRQLSTSQSRIQASSPPESSTHKTERLARQTKVKEAFQHAWTGYKEHAWLHDELKPVSGGFQDPFVGWAATLVDGLDALYILGFKEEFEHALQALRDIDFKHPNAERMPIFETTIRYLGGLLGAWDISGHQYPILLEKAKDLGDILYEAFDTDSGIPVPYYWWEKDHVGKLPGEDGVIIAQIGSLSLEFIRLSQVTGDQKYAEAIQRITDQLEATQMETSIPGLWPSTVDYHDGVMSFSSSSYTLGAFAGQCCRGFILTQIDIISDSLYEYLPKTHLLLQRKESQYLSMYHQARTTFLDTLVFRPNVPGNPDILLTGSINAGSALENRVEHLSCFVGGMVGLGSRLSQNQDELEIAAKLTKGCVWAYQNTPSGIMPEIFHVDACKNEECLWSGSGDGFSRVDDSSYQLRPEAIESVFIMYRLTGNPEWQEMGWRMFMSIESKTRTSLAHARLKNVMDVNPEHEDSMESFWLAETLKYFYLLFSDFDVVSLDEFVLNTEAHPLRWNND